MYDFGDLLRWATILERFAVSNGNTIGVVGAGITRNIAFPPDHDVVWATTRISPVVDISINSSAVRHAVILYAYDAQEVANALPVLLPQLGIPTDGVGVIRSRPVKWCKSASSCCCCLGGCRLREIGLRKSFVEGENGGCEVSTSDDPFVVLLSQDGANEAAHGRPVREDAHHIGASPDLLVETLLWVVGPELLPVGEWEAGEGQDVGSRFVQ